MERRVANAFPGPPPPLPYYHNNNYNPHHHQIHPPPVPAVGFHQYPQNDNRDHRFNQPHFDHYSGQQQNMIVDHNNNAPPPFPPSPCGGSLRKRRSQSATDTADGSIAKLYLAPVSKAATEDDIRQVFEKYGNVTEVILPKDKLTGERTAYCFVKYKNIEEGNAAIAALTDQYTFPGEMAPVKVRFADAERERERIGFSTVQIPDKLYVRSLNKQTTKMEVHEVFSRYGVIEDIYMALDDMKISRGYAFVQFSRREMALAAIKALNGVFTMRGSDQPLTVRFADPKKPRLGEPRSTFNTPPAMQQFDPNWRPQPYPQWENKEPAAPRVVQHHDFASQPNHFPHQPIQALSEVHKQVHQDIPPQNVEKHQISEPASVETRSESQKISSHSNASLEDQNTVSSECDWSEHICPDGNTYYFHCITCESTWEKPEEYSMFERWFEEQTKLKDQKLVSSPINNQSHEEMENTEQVQSHLLQQNTKLGSLPLNNQIQEKIENNEQAQSQICTKLELPSLSTAVGDSS